MTVQEWLGNDNVIGHDIWEKKYRYNNETFEEWLDRVSAGNEDVRQLIKDKKFLFGGRILANRGLHNDGVKVTYSNCYVVTPPEDNIKSIFDCASRMARTYSYGGGVGVDISNLAPRGAKVNNTAKQTSGAISFMDLYSLTTGLIGQNGRRGALMISLDCNHPDIEEFIGIKSDLNKVTKANISIKITDDFMQAVMDKKPYTLTFTRPETNETVTKTVDAAELFHKIAEMNWDYAEPGALFWDRIKSWNLLSNTKEFEYAGTNPCFTGDMQLLTEGGFISFAELDGLNVNLINSDGRVTLGRVWRSGGKETVKIIFADKSFITCTPNHVFMTLTGEECQAKDLKNKRIMPYTSNKTCLDKDFIKLGFIQGDGQISRILSQSHMGIDINVGVKDGDIRDLFADDQHTSHDRSIYVTGYKEKLIQLGFSSETLPFRTLPTSYSSWSKQQKASFLQGCFSANGGIIKHTRISYKTTCKQLAEEILNSLSKDFDINGYITTNKPTKVRFANGEYECRQSYDINIHKYSEIYKFYLNVNFYQNYKRIQLQELLKERSPYVYNVVPNGVQTVYDFFEPERHWGVVNGFIAHNCAEEPLPPGGSCLLGSINLAEFVIDPFTSDAKFDYTNFNVAIGIVTKAMNDVLDEGLPLHPLEEQRKSVSDWRQIGIGIMGLADMLIKLGIRYGSEESIKLCDDIGFCLADQAIYRSALLAKGEESFPKCNISEICNTQFFNINASNDTRMTVQYGLRNSQLLTIAPTGTLSNLLGISSGIEPIYAISYTRKTESLHNKDVYYEVFTPIVKYFMNANGITNKDELPDYFITSHDLNCRERIDMQSVWQTHIDAAISSTINVPVEFTIEDTEDLYKYAWQKGLKGVTIFRDGCKRLGILTTDNAEPATNTTTNIPRGIIEDVPEGLTYRKYRIKSGCGKLYLFVGMDESEGKIYDCFTNTDGVGGCTVNTQANSRLLSACIRGGIPIEYVIEQLQKSGTCPSYQYARGQGKDLSKGKSCPSAIAHILKEIMDELKDDQDEVIPKPKPKSIKPPKYRDLCPECGAELMHEGGCVSCKCGYSKCS